MLNFKEIICGGGMPVDAFNGLIDDDQNISNSDLARIFADEFPGVSGEAVQAIWHWQRPGKRPGIDDDTLNKILLGLLKDAGYLIAGDN
ncbi:hypothetical protein [Pseudomonas indica]|uniref:hypothetical protein n=1 Tax=Pseudomonas indica TaxID=137658 RepID=UPI001140EB52|nr:hypothetical protein [Pseudomonas indica]